MDVQELRGLFSSFEVKGRDRKDKICLTKNRIVTCDALVLAYSPDNVLEVVDGGEFYIPSRNLIYEGFVNGFEALPDHLGIMKRFSAFHNSQVIGDMFEAVKDIASQDSLGELGGLSFYLNSPIGVIERSEINSVYRFKDGERARAEERFLSYWRGSSERECWSKIQENMREFLLKKGSLEPRKVGLYHF